ncbi:hypothetical protein Purlil1_12722 [Purpureocillium lilacinum]|uniref:Fungal N-terminal domain-containing protein n=1 Tax=Purpureocillium lilacinum TaxID=33203 RepID=A0ABR0BG47_PURLI|nr:hypothetical protein Purlil1_12722 [Purpureocillium lilacinum]
MSDPSSVAGSAVGLVSLAITVAQGLVGYYAGFRGQADHVAHMIKKLSRLLDLLESLRQGLERRQFRVEDRAIFANMQSSIDDGEELIRELEELQALIELHAWSEPGLHLLVSSRDEIDIRVKRGAFAEEIVGVMNDSLRRDVESVAHGGDDLAEELPVLKRAQKSAAARVGKIVTAQTIWEIYSEAWTLYATALHREGADNISTMPSELPCWMKARKNFVPADNGWVEYVFAHERTWNGKSHSCQVYRSFESLWTPISGSAGQFDNRLKKIIGTFVLVTFNSNNTKEVGTNHNQSNSSVAV